MQRVASATKRAAEIQARGHWPLLVGGTMLYFKALTEGIDAMPASNAQVRAALAAQMARDGLPSLYRELQAVDPPTAARLKPGDTQRILRALEVHRISGQPLSAFHRGRPAIAMPPLISLEPSERNWLHRRIASRFTEMLANGLLDEVAGLRARGDLHPDLPSMRCVGYRQAWEALEMGDHSALAERGIAATRQLAKRQMTWLRGMSHRHVVASDAPDALTQAVRLAQQFASTQPPHH